MHSLHIVEFRLDTIRIPFWKHQRIVNIAIYHSFVRCLLVVVRYTQFFPLLGVNLVAIRAVKKREEWKDYTYGDDVVGRCCWCFSTKKGIWSRRYLFCACYRRRQCNMNFSWIWMQMNVVNKEKTFFNALVVLAFRLRFSNELKNRLTKR